MPRLAFLATSSMHVGQISLESDPLPAYLKIPDWFTGGWVFKAG